MWAVVKKYWDLIIGFIVGLALSIISHYDCEILRLMYSIVILILACMGLFRFIRQTMEKGAKKRKDRREHSLLDAVVDNQLAVKAIRLAQEPTKVGKIFKTLMGGIKHIMKKLKEIFDKYKGYLLTVLLGVLSFIEIYGGYINNLCGGKLMFKGIAVLPTATLVIAFVVGMLSNGYSKGQMEKIKALFSRSSTDELVKAEIKKNLKDNTVKHTEFTKLQSTKEAELENLQTELEGLTNTLNAKKEMYKMIPQLATAEDVQFAEKAVSECARKVSGKEAEIEEVKAKIDTLNTTINALKSQL